MTVIVVTGMPGAGKEEFLTSAIKKNIPFIRMGDLVRTFYNISDEKDRMNMGQFANSERERLGKNIWAKRAIEKMSSGMFLIDGCRSMDEARAFRELRDDVVIIGIHSSPEARYERLVRRGRDDAPRNIGEFNDRDSRELSWGLGEVLALSDFMIVNASTLDSFHAESERILSAMMR